MDASDIVQETLIEAHAALPRFRGSSDAELLGWLRRILANNIAAAERDHRRQKRDIELERSLASKLEQSSRALVDALAAEIARGGMGVVYRARDRRLERDVALKTVIGGRFATPELVARSRREILACSRLSHENIVPVYDVGSADGVHFYTMELLDGGCLRYRAPGSRADLVAIATTIATVARAVHFAHERGVLHRDLKPANVLLDGGGTPHVSDFGLAQILDDDSRLTLSGHAIGSPSYMAPELVDRNRGDPSTRTDGWDSFHASCPTRSCSLPTVRRWEAAAPAVSNAGGSRSKAGTMATSSSHLRTSQFLRDAATGSVGWGSPGTVPALRSVSAATTWPSRR